MFKDTGANQYMIAQTVVNEWQAESVELAIVAPTASKLIGRLEREIDIHQILADLVLGKTVKLDGKKMMTKIKAEYEAETLKFDCTN